MTVLREDRRAHAQDAVVDIKRYENEKHSLKTKKTSKTQLI